MFGIFRKINRYFKAQFSLHHSYIKASIETVYHSFTRSAASVLKLSDQNLKGATALFYEHQAEKSVVIHSLSGMLNLKNIICDENQTFTVRNININQFHKHCTFFQIELLSLCKHVLATCVKPVNQTGTFLCFRSVDREYF